MRHRHRYKLSIALLPCPHVVTTPSSSLSATVDCNGDDVRLWIEKTIHREVRDVGGDG